MNQISKKSIYDLVELSLKDRKYFHRIIALLLSTLILISITVIITIFAIFEITGSAGIQSLEVSPSHIKFARAGPSSADEYLVLVHPQGFVGTKIEIRQGDRIKIQASGKVNLMLDGIVSSITKRKGYEGKKAQNILPEKKLTKLEIDSIILKQHPWVGPNGFETDYEKLEQLVRTQIKKREKLRVEETANWGEMLAIIYGNEFDENLLGKEHYQFMRIGDEETIFAEKSGFLGFMVNDYLYIPNDELVNRAPLTFFDNNLGFFWVKVTISK